MYSSSASSNDVIILFIMAGCGYCNSAKSMFSNEISSGKMIVSSDGQDELKSAGLRAAYPTFKSMKTGKFHQGLPKSKGQLMKALGHSEGFAKKSQSMNSSTTYNDMNPLMGYKIDPASIGWMKAGVL